MRSDLTTPELIVGVLVITVPIAYELLRMLI